MAELLFPAPEVRTVPVEGTEALYPVHRIFCVGRNYAAHAAEMGAEVDREAPFYFTKSLSALALSGQVQPYPPGTSDYHHEVELAVALGAGGFRVSVDEAGAMVFGYAAALDMTRRDLQARAKDKRRPWDLGKDVEGSAVLAPLTRADDFAPGTQRIHLAVNGETRQDGRLDEMVHSVPEIIADLSLYYHLRAGDVILTGTPAGVGSVTPGDRLTGGVEGLQPISLTLGPAL
ncbi:fumarylacetoacetate hydrolase family protein [Aliiroseovarius sp.]|uniref:fumarylacetoacetate hydrolase family protein n=1 Tax=Aliiroseovarius sp. TaxID=1872442 RepID=UPI003BAC6863